MNDLDYSTNARNVLHRFHEVDKIVYVEGSDDEKFWSIIFEKFSNLSVKIEEVGGKPQLEKYVEKIVSGKLDALIAIDSDYPFITIRKFNSPQILLTYGYSIENTIITQKSTIDAIQFLSKGHHNQLEALVEEWFREFYASSRELVIADMVAQMNNLGICIIGRNCNRFMNGRHSPYICDSKIKSFIQELSTEFSDRDKRFVVNENARLGRSVPDLTNGHFLFSAVYRLIVWAIRKSRQKASLSNDALLAILLLLFRNIFDHNHPHYRFYRSAIEEATST